MSFLPKPVPTFGRHALARPYRLLELVARICRGHAVMAPALLRAVVVAVIGPAPFAVVEAGTAQCACLPFAARPLLCRRQTARRGRFAVNEALAARGHRFERTVGLRGARRGEGQSDGDQGGRDELMLRHGWCLSSPPARPVRRLIPPTR